MNNSRFIGRLIIFGGWRIFTSLDFLLALLIACILLLGNMFLKVKIPDLIIINTFNFSLALLSVIIAAFAIFTTLTDKAFLRFIAENDICAYDRILFHFEFAAGLSILTILFSILAQLISNTILIIASIFWFLYLVFDFWYLICFISRFGSSKARFELINSDEKGKEKRYKISLAKK